MIFLYKICWVTKMLYVFIEGPDDERFFSTIYARIFKESKFIPYAEWPYLKIDRFIRSIDCTSVHDYIFLGDADGHHPQEKAQRLKEHIKSLNLDKTYIVQYEIESWYYAGVNPDACRELNLRQYEYCTDMITKEQFNAKLPKKADRKYVMTRILAMYDLEYATARNRTLYIFNRRIREEPA